MPGSRTKPRESDRPELRTAEAFSRVELQCAGRRLDARTFPPPVQGPRGAAVLFIHGWESSQDSYRARAERVSGERGATSLAFDLSGHGESGNQPDSFTLRDHLADSIAAFDYLAASSSVDDRRIGVCGASYGGYLAASLIEHRPVKGLLLRAPALYADSALDLAAEARRPEPDAPHGAIPLRNLSDFDRPTLIVESEKDEVIPRSVIDSYLDASPSPSHAVLKHARHALTDPRWDEAFIQLLVEWSRAL
jgi:pimeloyl-ACP methyl ester carboxylesterase